MSNLYLLALGGVCAMLLGVLLEAILTVSRKPQWGAPRRSLTLLPTVDRRTQNLPFVGAERRRAPAAAARQQGEALGHRNAA